MKKILFYEDNEVSIYSKKEVDITDHGKMGDILTEIGLISYLKFSELLKDPTEFWQRAKANLKIRMEFIEEMIAKLPQKRKRLKRIEKLVKF